MARKFTITTPSETVRLDAQGRGTVNFTLTNTTATLQRVLLRAAPAGTTQASWLSVQQPERDFPGGGTAQVPVSVTVPPGTAPGRYSFRLDVVSAQRTGEDFEEGPTVTVEVAPAEVPKKSRWWIWAALAALLLVAGIVAWIALRPKADPDPEPQMVEVPAVTAKQEADAVQVLKSRGLVENVVRTESKEHAAGIVMSQEPQPGTPIAAGEKVTIVVASRPKAETVLLRSYWSPANGDNLTTSQADFQAFGYGFVRDDGYVYANEQPGTVQLKAFWSPGRQDHYLAGTTIGEKSALDAGYIYVGSHGFVFPTEQPDTVPLKSFWNDARGDNYTTATTAGEKSALDAGYVFVRVEGYVFKSGGMQ